MTKTKTLWAAVLTLLAGFAYVGAASAADLKLVKRGEYLVKVGGCIDCHTATKMTPQGPQKDMDAYMAGHPEKMDMPPAPALPPGPWIATVGATMTAWNGPWGTSYTANLTPDAETGLGKWTEKEFIETVRSGRHLGRGRPILPPMPIESLQAMNDADLKAVFAFLKSLKPVKNHVPTPLPPAPATAAK